jgi:hypothetical protein
VGGAVHFPRQVLDMCERCIRGVLPLVIV